jgi:hypothetical protein
MSVTLERCGERRFKLSISEREIGEITADEWLALMQTGAAWCAADEEEADKAAA